MTQPDLLGTIALVLCLLNASNAAGLLLYGLFVFNLGDGGVAPARPLLMALDMALQLFLNLLQLVAGSMVWRLRVLDKEPQLLAGLQRAGVVIAALQWGVLGLFGAVSETVLQRGPYLLCVAMLGATATALLWRIWHTDMLSDRALMLATAARFDGVAMLMVCAYGMLKCNLLVDAWATGSESFANAARDHIGLAFAAVCAACLAVACVLWASSGPSHAHDRKNPLDVERVSLIQRWNVGCAVLALFGPPAVVPCLVACVLAGATVSNTLPSEAAVPADIFYRLKGAQDRFDMEY